MKNLQLPFLFLVCILVLKCKSDKQNHLFCKSVCYDDVQKAVKNNSLIIDVRSKQEVAESGLIPTSVNIPLGCLRSKLEMSRKDFKDEFNHSKPKKRTLIIVTGRTGMPNSPACEILCFLGFKKVRDYVGGYEDFERRDKECRPPPAPYCSHNIANSCEPTGDAYPVPTTSEIPINPLQYGNSCSNP